MAEPQTYPSAPVEIPLRQERDPDPVSGCKGCAELDKVREWARQSGDRTTITDANVLIRRHPDGH